MPRSRRRNRRVKSGEHIAALQSVFGASLSMTSMSAMVYSNRPFRACSKMIQKNDSSAKTRKEG
jgi:hypothetical protein